MSKAYNNIPMRGVLDPVVQLVPAGTINNVTQVFAAAVGTIGGAILGAALSPLISSGDVPTEALVGVAQACVRDAARCGGLVALPVKHTGLTSVALVIGGLLVLAQMILVAVMTWRRRGQGGPA